MSFLNDWQFWFQLLTFLTIAGSWLFNWFSHQKIVGNDLCHLSKDLKEIAGKQDKQDEKINKMAVDLAYIKGKEENNDKIIKVLEKTLDKK